MSNTWSPYQEAIFNFVEKETGNATVEACPGSGKTTVIEEAIKRIPTDYSVLAMAFNRHIRDELRRRLNYLPNVTVHTLNSFGNSLLSGWYKINSRKCANILKFDIFELTRNSYSKEKYKKFAQFVGPITKLMSICKGHMVFTVEDLTLNYEKLMDEYDIDSDEDEFFQYLTKVFQIDQQKTKVFDYDDQIAVPLRRGLPIPRFDYVFVDEAQDLNPAKTELALKAAKKGRAIFVGDRNQAIYHFAGASSNSMDRIQMQLDAVPFPLSICYRCAKSVVNRAQQVFPVIECWEDAPEGVETTITEKDFRLKAEPGDVVLCRTTAPVVQECLKFIRQGIKAVVKGREIGKDLCNLVMKIANDNGGLSTEDFIQDLRVWYEKESEKLKRADKEEKQILLSDKYDTIHFVACEYTTVGCIVDFFEKIFGDEDRTGITLMTIHKAKGLEAKRIFILRPDQLPHKMAKSPEAMKGEKCLEYVAITRAQEELYWVLGDQNEH
jgi:DNA helicase-2/ATP-dependent DNA helicase PcrA